MHNVGEHIRSLRKEKGLTQDELAAQLHVTRQTVSNYETGKSEPDLDMLVRIAEVLETDVNTLLNTACIATVPPVQPWKQLLPPAVILALLWLTQIGAGYCISYLRLGHPFGGWNALNVLYSHTDILLLMLLGYLIAVCFELLSPQLHTRFENKWHHRILTALLLFYLVLLSHQIVFEVYSDMLYYQWRVNPTTESFTSPTAPIQMLTRCLIWIKTRYHLYEFITVPTTILWGMALRLTKTKKTAAVD